MSLLLRVSGSGVQCTPSNRLPLHTPYERPQPRDPSHSGHSNAHRSGGPMHGGGTGNGGAGNGGAGNGGGRLPSGDICQKLLDEMRFGREEQKGIREDVRRLSQLVTRLEDNSAQYQRLSGQIQ